jgi:hypothetical protein
MKELNVNLKMMCFDMDGTIADLYGVEDWLSMLRNENPLPYEIAKPMWDMIELAEVLNELRAREIEIRIISWLSKDSTETYKEEVRQAKIEWLERMGFPYDKAHFVQYGTTKADCVRRYLADDECAILVDDNRKVCNGWHLGETINPTECDLIATLKSLLG